MSKEGEDINNYYNFLFSIIKFSMSVYDKYEMVIGLEIHVKLNSPNKLFCKCKNEQDFENVEPNTYVCPVCS
jgi:Zn finger protein HypA/HybF involved in hydrogenase expression